jgi:hypothetical protein
LAEVHRQFVRHGVTSQLTNTHRNAQWEELLLAIPLPQPQRHRTHVLPKDLAEQFLAVLNELGSLTSTIKSKPDDDVDVPEGAEQS